MYAYIAERMTPDLVKELCESPGRLRQYAKEQATKYPTPESSNRFQSKRNKRKAASKLDSELKCKTAKLCLLGMKAKDALDKNLLAPATISLAGGSSVASTNGDETSSISSNRPNTRDLNYSDVDNEDSTIELNLRRLCALTKLTPQPEDDDTASEKEKSVHEKEYKVSKIIKIEYDNEPLFLVKWEGYSKPNWEPVENIWDCGAFQAFTAEFIRTRKSDMEQIWNEMIATISAESLEPKLSDFEAIQQIHKFDYNRFLAHFFMMTRFRRANIEIDEDYQLVYDFLMNDMKHLTYYIRRLDQLQNMYEFQQRINIIDQSKNLHVENIVDLEMPPIDEFTYTNDVIPRDGIVIPDDPPVGCDCAADGQCSAKSQCCPMQFEAQFPYTARGLVRVKQGTPIFECNKACKCSKDCPNRVVQKGRKQTLCIFKTKERGWGVRTERAIAKGQYICEYVGEIISFEETERRGKEYDAVGRTYLFDLDFNEKDNPYTVDAAKFGNVSRFINHSCDPNLGVWAVWTDCLDLNLPKLCLFTLRPIKENEELTFDYVNCTNSRRLQSDDIISDESSAESFAEDTFKVQITPPEEIEAVVKEQFEAEAEAEEELLLKPESNIVDDNKPTTVAIKAFEPIDKMEAKEVLDDTKKEGFTCKCGAANCRKIIFC